MFLNILFTIIFILGVYYLIQYRMSIKKAVDLSKEALFPQTEEEFQGILIPTEYKEMEPLSKSTKSYKFVKWGTVIASVVLLGILMVILTTDFLGSSFFSMAYLFFAIISAIRHRGNLFLLPKGIILQGRYFSYSRVREYEVERIVRWHDLYGINDRMNFSYQLTIKVKGFFPLVNFVVVENEAHLEKIIELLEMNGVMGKRKADPSQQTAPNIRTKS
ncbi:hypothetical protein [Bacillus sp. REN16]|uniref:hypothetical protein n=1 Tax=Bacillus sp. REN16 TaxID=2887296 RepID=UPI001E36EEC4|nr:hypothetical protein [Bacillus sp. REN16]MCC3358553.1 hypothetical protein [Bacillus sp. REN16]